VFFNATSIKNFGVADEALSAALARHVHGAQFFFSRRNTPDLIMQMVCPVFHQKQIALSKTHSTAICGGTAAISAKATGERLLAPPAACSSGQGLQV
jgi:hypothetical protein